MRPIAQEPWVHLADAAELAGWGKPQEIEYNQQARQAEKARFFAAAFDFLTENRVGGDYWEFGCHRARTFRMALTEARRHNLDEMRFVAFDSFEGLPEAQGQVIPEWKEGALKTSADDFMAMVRSHGIYTDRVDLVEGFYRETLNDYTNVGAPALVTVDCDLYASARDVFRFLSFRVRPGTMIYVDDYFVGYRGSPLEGVQRAFLEFKARVRLVPHMQIGWWGRSFIVY